MNHPFEHTSASWMHYSGYHYETGKDGGLYVVVDKDAEVIIKHPINSIEEAVLHAVNIGMMVIQRSDEEQIKREILRFISTYGFLGFITALPTTPDFINYDAAYFPMNHFIKEESLPTEDYLKYFYPFEKPKFIKNGVNSQFTTNDVDEMALMMTMGHLPTAVHMSFQMVYAERYDWLKTAFLDMAYPLVNSMLFYHDFDDLSDRQKRFMQEGMSSFGCIAPTYRVMLEMKKDGSPYLVWDFHSLLVMLQMMFSFMVTDSSTPLRICENCYKAFLAPRKNARFCSKECMNRFKAAEQKRKND